MPDGNTNTGAGSTGQQGQDNRGQQQSNQGQQQNSETPFAYDSWLAQQSEDVRTGIEAHITGLRNTVQATRQERDSLAQQLRDAAKSATGEVKAQLDKLTGDLEAANTRADFFEEAAKPDVGCTNPRLAFIAADQAGLIDKKGRVNWAEMRKQYPELFRQAGQQKGSADGGAGGDKTPTGNSMNDFIRKAAGR